VTLRCASKLENPCLTCASVRARGQVEKCYLGMGGAATAPPGGAE